MLCVPSQGWISGGHPCLDLSLVGPTCGDSLLPFTHAASENSPLSCRWSVVTDHGERTLIQMNNHGITEKAEALLGSAGLGLFP